MNPPGSLVDALDAALPQTQCTRCGYDDCRSYAVAIAEGAADINQCPPGGDEGIARLAALTGRSPRQLNPANGCEGARQLAVIDEAWCIGCTLCLQACPVDCIVGGPKAMHSVIEPLCTGCELCVPVCPVDCISLIPITGARTGWQAWSTEQAAVSKQRYGFHVLRLAREAREQGARMAAAAPEQEVLRHLPAIVGEPVNLAPVRASKQAVIEAALARARETRRIK